MPQSNRFQDENLTLSDFYKEVWVVCPYCAEKAIAAGAKETFEAQDYGFMFQRNFEDLDGNLWEVFYMDKSKIPQE